jgi:WD40 repeat protein
MPSCFWSVRGEFRRNRLVLGTSSGEILQTGRELRTLQGHTTAVVGVALSGDGRRAVSASWGHTLKVWNVETGEVTATFTCDAQLTVVH